MDKEAHKFREFFTLIDPTKKTANKKAVCNFCIKEYTLSVASCRTGCFVSNKAKLCRAHLKKCINFEYEDSSEENEENKEPLRSTTKTQSRITNYVSRSLSKKDVPYFEILLLQMLVSNGLAFTFFENQETKDVFTFIAPALKLPSRKAMSDRILSKSTKVLTQSIIKIAQEDKIGVTAAFDRWTNVKQENLFGVIFITSNGETLIWAQVILVMKDQELKM
ncbi:hypothetical protein Glove_499g7 [Diversispora epigaea]|uniref:BED-type domain-containing protein n=1 Tax=Diversispora epigaea TaxID=1348612 RepID=A0A397GHH3_9GLOM|nr:hypothetical protein Glove_499g7 [Diversispora epigaea]